MFLHLPLKISLIKNIQTNIQKDTTPLWEQKQYAKNTDVCLDNNIYKALTKTNTKPSKDSLYWEHQGLKKELKIFDYNKIEGAQKEGEIIYEFSVRCDSLFFFGLEATSLDIYIDANHAHHINLLKPSRSWSDYFFGTKSTLKTAFVKTTPKMARYKIIIRGKAGCNLIAPTLSRELGQSEVGLRLSILDFSKKQTTQDGENLLRQGVSRTLADANVVIKAQDTDEIFILLNDLRGKAAIFSTNLTHTKKTIWGFVKNFTIATYSTKTSKLDIQIQSLT